MGLGEISLGEMGLGEMGLGEMGQNHICSLPSFGRTDGRTEAIMQVSK